MHRSLARTQPGSLGTGALSGQDSTDYAGILIAGLPLIDTRSPSEFALGAFPGAVNLPLMNDDERAAVGTCYKRKGQEAAIALGHALVQGELKHSRVMAWRDFALQNPQGYLYCFRGGLRSQIAQQWLLDAGVAYPRIQGGYKALRHFLLQSLQTECRQQRFLVVSGQTGCAKTRLLQQLPHAVDLEGLARHRGSAFGKRVGGQPSQIDFENSLAIALMRKAHAMPETMTLLEDESRLIGRLAVPELLREQTLQAPLAVIETDLEQRVEHTYSNYILHNLTEWQAHAGMDEGFRYFSEELLANLGSLQKRLGGYRATLLQKVMADALMAHANGKPEAHRQWIRVLLKDYYDPMYAYQLGLKSERVVFKGDYDAVMAYCADCRIR